MGHYGSDENYSLDWTDYLSGIGLGLGGIGTLGESLGLWEGSDERNTKKQIEAQKQLAAEQRQWQERMTNEQVARENARRQAIYDYLNKNMGQFQKPNFQFDVNQYSDILDPMRENMATEELGLRNRMALSGAGRGGTTQELMSRQNRRLLGDINKTIKGLSREEENKAYERAMQEYLANQERVKTIGAYA